MGDVTVRIYERVKFDNRWTRMPVPVPERRTRDGKLLLKDERRGIFQVSWYEHRKEQFQEVKCRVSDRELPFLSEAIAQAEDKAWFLSNHHRQIADPTQNGIARKKLVVEVAPYIAAKSGCRKTVSAHRQAVPDRINAPMNTSAEFHVLKGLVRGRRSVTVFGNGNLLNLGIGVGRCPGIDHGLRTGGQKRRRRRGRGGCRCRGQKFSPVHDFLPAYLSLANISQSQQDRC